MAGKAPALTCSCGAKMKRIYVRMDGSMKGIGNACIRTNCRNLIWDEASAFDKAWAILKRGNQ